MKTLLAIKSLLSLKVVLMGVMVMAVAGGLIGGGLFAYFSDTETSTGNTFTAGTIDIEVNGENPWWSGEWHFEVKPSEVKYIEFDIHNAGTNPVDIWKHLDVTDWGTGIAEYYCGDSLYYVTPTPDVTPTPQPVFVSSEPECEAEYSVWDPETQTWDATYWYPEDEVYQDTLYDLYASIGVVYPVPNIPPPEPPIADQAECEAMGGNYDEGEPEPGDETCTLFGEYGIPTCTIEEYDEIYVEDVWSCSLYLGELQPSEVMHVVQSYHLYDDPYSPEEQNYYQGDFFEFDIELYAQQVTGNVEPPWEECYYPDGCQKYID